MSKPTGNIPRRGIVRSPPAGCLSRVAWTAGILLVVASLVGGYFLSVPFAVVIAAYFLLNLAYSKWLKHILIVDVLVLAAGFVLRVDAGVRLIHVERFSPWLYVVMTLLALYLGFGKRRAELALLVRGCSQPPQGARRLHHPTA